MSLTDRITFLNKAIEAACLKAHRSVDSLELVAVTKGHGIEAVAEGRKAGLKVFGESYAQELLDKVDKIGSESVQWHFVGHLQGNKVSKIAPHVRMIQSVDSFALAERIDREAKRLGKQMPVLVQINIGEEEQKHGILPGEATSFLKSLAYFDALQVQGLMCIPPLTDTPQKARPYFQEMVKLQKQLMAEDFPGISLDTLSMGMSSDFRIAIEEGSTMIRVGQLLFGKRPTPDS